MGEAIFEYMPLLKDPKGIWCATGGMLIVAGSMLLFFKRKKWL